MRSCSDSYGARALTLLALVLTACAGGPRWLSPAERAPLTNRAAPRQPLPDDLERAAGRLAALALASQPDTAAEILTLIQERDAELEARGERPSGLSDNGLDLLNTLGDQRAYLEQAQEMLERGDIDPALRRRLERYIDSQPLNVANTRLREDRVRKVGSVFNGLIAPVSRFFTSGSVPTVETGRAAVASLLLMHSFPEATTQERQALRAYQEFLERNPDAPEREWVSKKVARYESELRQQLHTHALEAAERAMKAGGPEAALLHLDRADRLIPDDTDARELREHAKAAVERRDQQIHASLRAGDEVGIPLDPEMKAELEALARAVLEAPYDEVARHASAWQERHEAGPLSSEVRFLEAYWYLAHAEEDQFFHSLSEVAGLDPDRSRMARHARWILLDPEQNPYAFYRAALRADRRDRRRWILLGQRAHGPTRRGLPRPFEWILSLPGFATSLVTSPLRLLQYPGARSQFGGGVLHTGERYLAHFPEGEHAEEVNRVLEGLYANRGHWSQALEHHRARANPDPDKVASYREKIAERTLQAAQLRRRLDVRAAIYRSVIDEYGDTPQAESARASLKELVRSASPQRIRLSKEFLQEYPELWAPGALGLHPELLDGERKNGEMADEGITLLGRTLVEIPLVDKAPVVETVPRERFARFIAALEEVSYRRLVTDEREQPEPDPQRDLFFERARLGLLDDADLRPSARSEAVFLSTNEKYGKIPAAESILPLEIVLQGGLEDFGLAAFPRVRLPGETPDAFLYR